MALFKRLLIIFGVIMAVLSFVCIRLSLALAGRLMAWIFAGCLLISATGLWAWDKGRAALSHVRRLCKR